MMRHRLVALLCACASRFAASHRAPVAARREVLRGFGGAASLLAPTVAFALDPSFPRADEGTNKRNILLNKPLEWLRIVDQLEADESLSELADPNLKDAPALRLSKILKLDDALRGLGPALESKEGWKVARTTLGAPAFEKKNFKKAFNAYSDNVYYERNDPDRANLYLLGGTPPSSKQTIQYLHRNDALDNVEKLQSEVAYLLDNKDGDTDTGDLKSAYAAALKAFDAYFSLCPEEDRKAARAIAGPGGPRARAS